MKSKVIITLLALAIVLVPLTVVNIVRSDNTGTYSARVRISDSLDQTLNGKLHYYLVERIDGESPEETFVIATDRDYTRGIAAVDIEEEDIIWVEGGLMTRDIFFGEQYLFFDHPQIYVSQVKKGGLWPDQLTELRVLYLSPFTSLTAVVTVWYLPFVEEYTLDNFLVFIGKTVLIAATVFLLFKRHKKQDIAIILLSYSLLAMLLTLPILTDLY